MAEMLIVPARPANWAEIFAAFCVGLICGIWAAVLFYGQGVAFAGGPVTLKWDQAGDCPTITSFDVLTAPITTAQPNPPFSAAIVAATFPNGGSGAPPCGLAMQRTVSLSGVGTTRVWLRAVAGATKSAESNGVDSSFPLAAPSGLTVAVP